MLVTLKKIVPLLCTVTLLLSACNGANQPKDEQAKVLVTANSSVMQGVSVAPPFANESDKKPVTAEGITYNAADFNGQSAHRVIQIFSPQHTRCIASLGASTDPKLQRVVISCENTAELSVTVSGLGEGHTIELQLNDGFENLLMSSNAQYTFTNQLAVGSDYQLLIKQQPLGQSCQFNENDEVQATGQIPSSRLNLVIHCQVIHYKVSGQVVALADGFELELSLQGVGIQTEVLKVSGSQTFEFESALPDNAEFEFAITKAVAGQLCVASPPQGRINQSDFVGLAVNCSPKIDDISEIEALPLIYLPNFKYEGAFQIKDGLSGDGHAYYPEGSIAYRAPSSLAPNGSLFISGTRTQGVVGEFPIPKLNAETDINDLQKVPPIQDFKAVLSMPSLDVTGGTHLDMIGSLQVYNDHLLFSAHRYYPADNRELHAASILTDVADLSNSDLFGYFQIDKDSAIRSHSVKEGAGWLSELPEQYKKYFNATHLFGPSDGWSIDGRNAVGPATFVVDLDEIVNAPENKILDSEVLMDFDRVGNKTIRPLCLWVGNTTCPADDFWSVMTFVHYGFIPKGTRTLALLGTHHGRDSDLGYKHIDDLGNQHGGPGTYIAADNYNYYWLFDMNDLIAANKGEIELNSVKPYSYGIFDVPFQPSDFPLNRSAIKGASYDPVSNALYIALTKADDRTRDYRGSVYLKYDMDTEHHFSQPKAPINFAAKVQAVTNDEFSVALSWQGLLKNDNEASIEIKHYRLFLEKQPYEASSLERGRAKGFTLDGNVNSFDLSLSAGNWLGFIYAIDSNGIPGHKALLAVSTP